jgi:predicted dehydrogenase
MKSAPPARPLSRRRFLRASTLALGGATLAGPQILRGAAAATPANSRFNLAVVGCGGQGRSDLKNLLSAGAHLVALCDVDPGQIEKARAEALKVGGEATLEAKAYEDYRRLVDDAASFDGVLIATPDHWHAPLCRAFLRLGKHVYCEKPLTHTLAEARELRELARRSKVVTQMGNQGSASNSLRRCTELIRAGVLGQIREIRHWGVGVVAKEGTATGEDPVPPGLNWDLWVGPAALRPYKETVYHPYRWRDWFDLGNGGLADICCHAMNLPVRALDLSYPTRLVVKHEDGQTLTDQTGVEFHFPARGKLAPLVLHWQGKITPPADLMAPLVDVYKDKLPKGGLMIFGEKGLIYTSHWNTNGLIRLEGEPRLMDVTLHAATRDVPQTLPRVKGHEREWVDACRGEGRTFSDFDTGGLVTEIGLAGVVALRAGQSLDWDGAAMRATNAPAAARFVRSEDRKKWLI